MQNCKRLFIAARRTKMPIWESSQRELPAATRLDHESEAGRQKWVQTPRGLPPVAGETSAERAWLVRYFMTRDDQTAFARVLGIDISTWNQFERGIRPLSRPVIDKIVDVVPGITHLYLIRNVKGGLGPAFLHMLNMSIDASRRRST